jgi:hypothetical protein
MNRVYSIWSFPNIAELIACDTTNDHVNAYSILENIPPELNVLSPPFIPRVENNADVYGSGLDDSFGSTMSSVYESRLSIWGVDQSPTYNPRFVHNFRAKTHKSEEYKNAKTQRKSKNYRSKRSTVEHAGFSQKFTSELFGTEEQVQNIVSKLTTENEILKIAKMIKDTGVTEEEKKRVKYLQSVLFMRLQEIIYKEKK